MRLYGVNPKECYIVDKGCIPSSINTDFAKVLKPNYEGDYTL